MMMNRFRWLSIVLSAFLGSAVAGRAAAAPTSCPEEVIQAVLLHLQTDFGTAPVVVDLRDVCTTTAVETCASEFEQWLTATGMRPRVEGSRSFCLNAEPPCASGAEILIRLGPPELHDNTATVRVRRWQPTPSGREPMSHMESEVVLSHDRGWKVKRHDLRWRT
jgi:hypothetical protein